ncbi:cobalamin biosynthesis protein CobN [Solibacillus sp. FSL R5-0691]|uniref:cobalamin biosynthesis protein CobN n=1 Tax=Solibacillus sp. FSL R5-0691 TaxID=2921653 RepID=UPI0030D38EC3
MLIGFYSALIIFTLLFIIAAFFFIRQFVNKKVSPYNLNTIMLGVLSLFMLIVSGIYSYDFYHLQTGDQKTAGGSCEITFVNGHGRSIDTTEVTIENKVYNIKSSTYKDFPDGHYQCELTFLPITKIVTQIDIVTTGKKGD